MDSSIKKESDLPAADPNTPIPLKYEDRSANSSCAAEKGIALLLERGQSLIQYITANIITAEHSKFMCVFLHMFINSGAVAAGSKAPNTLRDDPRLLAASHEAAALLESLKGLLRPFGCRH